MSKPSTTGARQRSILVVEDDEDIRFTLRLFLESHGYRVDEAATGVEALERVGSGHLPDVVILDLRMPVMDGRACAAALRAEPETAKLPVFLMSGDPDVQTAADAIGVQGVLRKPVSIDELLLKIERALPR